MLVEFNKAVELILKHQIVAIPTETVYGLAGDATSESACNLIYETKKRPLYNPLIIHVLSLNDAQEYAEFNEDAMKIAKAFWPGPITLVLPKRKSAISEVATANLETIAIRVPAHPVIQELLIATKKPLAAPSANVSSRISPTIAEHVNKSFLGKVAVIDSGKTLYGIESTIIDCTNEPILLRYGFITDEVIAALLKKTIKIASPNDKINAPGLLKKHYSPNCPIRINAEYANSNELAINFGTSSLTGAEAFNLSPTGDLIEAAANLYSTLQKAEDLVWLKKLAGIAVVSIPESQLGLAINDKLSRASSSE